LLFAMQVLINTNSEQYGLCGSHPS